MKVKTVRFVVILIGVILLGANFLLSMNGPTATEAALDEGLQEGGEIGWPDKAPSRTPPPPTVINPSPTPLTPVPEPGNNDDDDNDAPQGAIRGVVTDLATGAPGRGLEIEINGMVVRSDSFGKYSLTGLPVGTYVASLRLPGELIAAQGSWTVYLVQEEEVLLDLGFYSQAEVATAAAAAAIPAPTPTATPAMVAEQSVAGPAVQPAGSSPMPSLPEARLAPIRPPGNDSPALWINPGHINNEQGVAGYIAIDVANVRDFGAFQATLYFDPKVIEVETVLLGNFLDSTGRETTPLITEVDNARGEVSFMAFTSGESAGPDGGGTLALVNFMSKQAGVSELTLEDVRLVSRLGTMISTKVIDGRILVSRCFGDLNDDLIIDISDVQIVSGRNGQVLGDPNYEVTFDVTSDGMIDQADIALITDRLYQTCP